MAGLLDFLQGANKGFWAGNLGAPVDMAALALNGLIAGGGYAGHKMGLLSTPPDLIEKPVGGSEWIADKMRRAGLLQDNPGSQADAYGQVAGGLLGPIVAAKSPQIARGLLQAADNLAAPTQLNKQAGVYLVAPNETNPKQLARVTAEMQQLGAPKIRAYWDGEKYIALEGSHRARAAKDLGITPVIDEVDLKQWFTNHDFPDLKPKISTDRVLNYLDYGQHPGAQYIDFQGL